MTEFMKTLKNLVSKNQNRIPALLGIGLLAGVALLMITGPIARRAGSDPSEMSAEGGQGFHTQGSLTGNQIPPGTQTGTRAGTQPETYHYQSGRVYSDEGALERRLEEVLSLADGVGAVRVMVTFIQGPTTVFAVDRSTNYSTMQEQDAQGGTRYQSSQQDQDKTLIITDRSGAGQPLIVTESPPVIGGVVIIAEGGDNVLVRESLARATSTLLDIDINRVQVMTMRSGRSN